MNSDDKTIIIYLCMHFILFKLFISFFYEDMEDVKKRIKKFIIFTNFYYFINRFELKNINYIEKCVD